MNTTSVYGQMVANGWVARDLLEVVARQNVAVIDNQVSTAKLVKTTNTLLVLGIAAIGLLGLSITAAASMIARAVRK